MNILDSLARYNSIIDIVSCLFTVLALVFTLYFWLLDHLSEDESKFIEGKEAFLKTLNECLDTIRNNGDPQALLTMVQSVNIQLEVVLNYRFWARSKKKEDYKKINEFYMDSKYLISTIRRYIETQTETQTSNSLVNIHSLGEAEMSDIQDDYRKGLSYIIDFIENWN